MAKERMVGELRKILQQTKAPWTVDSRLKDDDPIPVYPTGGRAPQKADPNARIDFHSILATSPAHSFLLERRIALGFVKPEHVTHPPSPATTEEGGGSTTNPSPQSTASPQVAPGLATGSRTRSI